MHLLLLALLGACRASAAAVEWSSGMGIWLYAQAQKADLQCPETNFAAHNFAGLCRVSVSAGGKVLCDSNPSETGRRFLNTNGFSIPDQPLVSDTRLKVAEFRSPTGGGCWAVQESTHEVGVSPCNLSDGSQKLYIRARGGAVGAFYIYTNTNADPLVVGTAGALTARDGAPIVFCMYDSDSGNLVTLPSSEPSYISPASITNLTGLILPRNDNLLPESVLTGCHEDTAPVDCLIARAVNGMPAECEADPSKRACVLHLVAAFCFDVPLRRVGKDSSAQVEACFNSVPLGPCVANPGGAACISEQFAGIAQFGSSGSGWSSRKRDISSAGSMTGLELRGGPVPRGVVVSVPIPIDKGFFAGIVKNLMNGVIDMINLFRDSMFQSSRISCLAMSTRFPDETMGSGESIRKGCTELFKPHEPIKNIPYDGPMEEAGAVFAEIVSILITAADVLKAAQAAKFVGGVKALLAKFSPRSLTVAEGVNGMVLEATNGPNTVRLFREVGDGKPMGLYTQEDFAAFQQSIGEEAFENCRKCMSQPVARDAPLYPRAVLAAFCCVINPKLLQVSGERWRDGSSPWTPKNKIRGALEPRRSIGELRNPAGHQSDPNLLPRMTDSFQKFYSVQTTVPLVTDAKTATWVKRLDQAATDTDLLQVRKDFLATYPMDPAEVDSIFFRMHFHTIDIEAMKSGLAKIPPSTGLVHRATDLSTETAQLLIDGRGGPISKGPRGIYEVRDLNRNMRVEKTSSRDALRFCMSTSLGFRVDFESAALYRFVINSQSGRYVAPIRPLINEQEVLFVQGFNGRFKLIGYQPLNGGEAARLAGNPGPYGVF